MITYFQSIQFLLIIFEIVSFSGNASIFLGNIGLLKLPLSQKVYYAY